MSEKLLARLLIGAVAVAAALGTVSLALGAGAH